MKKNSDGTDGGVIFLKFFEDIATIFDGKKLDEEDLEIITAFLVSEKSKVRKDGSYNVEGFEPM